MAEPIFEPLTPMSSWIGIAEHRLHPDLAARPDLDRTSRHVICPQIKCTAACQFEAGMVPVARVRISLPPAKSRLRTSARQKSCVEVSGLGSPLPSAGSLPKVGEARIRFAGYRISRDR